MTKRVIGTAMLLCAIPVITGCSQREYDTIPTHEVTGKVTVNGVPAAGAIVRFFPQTPQEGTEHPLAPSGKTNTEGIYQLTTYADSDGAPPGKYIVTVEWPDPKWRPEGGGMPPPPPDRLQGKFANPKTSQIEAMIKEGENLIAPIDLEDVEILKGSSLN